MKTAPANNASTLNSPPAGEVMTDRCSAEVAFVSTFNARPDSPGTIILIQHTVHQPRSVRG